MWNVKNANVQASAPMYIHWKNGHFQELVSRRTIATVLTHCNANT
jgi:hypothetical protein